MKNILAGLLCVSLCIAVAIFLPQTGTSNPNVDDTGCLECHPVADLHTGHSALGCDSCHESASGGGPVSTSSCIECHPVGDPGACNLVNLHPPSCLECHPDCEVTEGCAVTIDCEETTLCTDDDCITCEATTECDGEPVDGEYTWSLNMAGITSDNGTVEICPDDLELGDNELMVTDTANDAEDTEMLTLEECGPTECAVDVLVDSLPKSNWFVLPLVFRIETIGIDPLTILTPVTIECDADGGGPLDLGSVLQTGKVVLPNFGTNTTVIVQTVLVWPSWITQSGGREVETCTVTVDGCPATDTFDLNYLPFFLSE